MTFQIRTRISGQDFELASEQVVRAVEGILPDPIQDHYVVIAGRRFPPKQALSVVTGLDRADFTTHQARSVLRRLGFTAARRSDPVRTEPAGSRPPHGGGQSDALRPHIGKWVALKGSEVLVAADRLEDVVVWLERFDQQADMVFRVPSGPAEADLPLVG